MKAVSYRRTMEVLIGNFRTTPTLKCLPKPKRIARFVPTQTCTMVKKFICKVLSGDRNLTVTSKSIDGNKVIIVSSPHEDWDEWRASTYRISNATKSWYDSEAEW
mmetsp:Transcript_8743/g.11033  ORF Transcript_8743/g.11033 Transcript_8743/m.11033 type:complete len:105 (-) Transcript_8743:3-317(-)